MPDKFCSFIRENVMVIFTKSLLFTLWIMFLIPGGALQYLKKWKPTSLGFIQPRISQVLSVHKDLLLDLFLSSAVQTENNSDQFEPQKNIYCLDTAEFIGSDCSLQGMNKEESKVKVEINYGKSLLKVSPKIMVDYYNDF